MNLPDMSNTIGFLANNNIQSKRHNDKILCRTEVKTI